MGEVTGIQWTSHTWNPWQGCQKVSPGCDNCYMFRDKQRYGQDPETVMRSKPPTFRAPLKWNREARESSDPRRVFVASWADFFSREADEWRADAWAIIRECESLVFQVLTKRHARIAANLPSDWGDGYPNVWLGVSGENQEWADRRWAALSQIPARVRFISYEPAIDKLTMRDWPTVPDWLIIGGESGRDARIFDASWARALIAECRERGCAPFVKQLGAVALDSDWYGFAPLPLTDSHGSDPSEWPEDLRVREWPEVRHA